MRGRRADRDIARDEQQPHGGDRLAEADAAIPNHVELFRAPVVDVERQRQRREHRRAEQGQLDRQPAPIGRRQKIGEAADVLPRHHKAARDHQGNRDLGDQRPAFGELRRDFGRLVPSGEHPIDQAEQPADPGEAGAGVDKKARLREQSEAVVDRMAGHRGDRQHQSAGAERGLVEQVRLHREPRDRQRRETQRDQLRDYPGLADHCRGAKSRERRVIDRALGGNDLPPDRRDQKKAEDRPHGCEQGDDDLEAGAVLVDQPRQQQQANRESRRQALEEAEKRQFHLDLLPTLTRRGGGVPIFVIGSRRATRGHFMAYPVTLARDMESKSERSSRGRNYFASTVNS